MGDKRPATSFLVEKLPPALWEAPVPGTPRKTVRMLAAHVHNSRCSWIRTVGREHGLPVPQRVDPRRVSRRSLGASLARSAAGVARLLQLAIDCGGTIPAPKTYVWRNLPLDVGHLLVYLAAHEAHHRGQIVLIARQLGQRLPTTTTGGLWQFTTFSRQSGKRRRRGKG